MSQDTIMNGHAEEAAGAAVTSTLFVARDFAEPDEQTVQSTHVDVGMALVPEPQPRVTLVIPTKNEARNLAWVLGQVPACVDEVVLVDASTDATRTTAMACRPDIRIVEQPRPGKGNALRAGFAAARGEFVVMMDADGSMSPAEISRFVYFLENGFDFVKGSRFVSGGGSLDITPFRRAGNHALLWAVNAMYDSNMTDLCYGFCAFNRRYLDHLDLTADGFDIEAQMVVHALQAGLRIAEVPSLETQRLSGRSNLRAISDGTLVLRAVLRDHHRGLSGRLVQGLRKVERKYMKAAEQPCPEVEALPLNPWPSRA